MSLLEMSITGGIMVLAVTVLRAVLLNKLPKRAFVFLWELAMLKLILPISIPSVFSIYTLFNQMGTSYIIETPQETITNAPVVGNFQTVAVPATQNTYSVVSIPVWTIVWLAGMTISLAFFIVGYIIVFRKYRFAVLVKSGYPVEWLLEQNNRRKVRICLSNETSTPLTYGIFHPTILLPENTDTEKSERLTYILTHEMVHIKRFDMVRKVMAALVLSVHWFNPIVWAMFVLYNRDIELACDEAVVRKINADCRSAYAMALIGMEEERRKISLFNHFSKNAVEERIVAIMKTKRLTLFAGIITMVLICGVTAVFATSASYANTKDPSVDMASYSFDADDYDKLLALQFEDYRHMRISEFQNKVWKMTDTPEYRELLDRISKDDTLYNMKDNDELASFLFYVLEPLTAEKWETRTYSGSAESSSSAAEDSARIEYAYTLTVFNTDIMVKEYFDIGLSIRRDVFQNFLDGYTKEDLCNETFMRGEIDAYINAIVSDMQTPELNVSIEYAYFPSTAPNDNHQEIIAGGEEEREERRFSNATTEDYNSLLSLKTDNYTEMSVADFNAILLEWANSDYDRTQRIQEDISLNDFSVNLSTDELSFVTLTYILSNTENYMQLQGLVYGGIVDEPTYGGFDYYKDDNGNSLKWARLYYQLSYHISDKNELTVGERDRSIGNFIGEIKRFWDAASLDELLKMSENDIVSYMQKTAEQFCGNNLTIHIGEDDVLFEGKNEQAYQFYTKDSD
ncbi:MAG: M56 family metallopeptidase [Eubacterium sp.]|nr:M56 family metallopeptidase [Eubacterium sp.]